VVTSPSRAPVTVLLSDHAAAAYGERVAASPVPTRLARVQGNGRLLVDGRPTTVEEAAPEVAWLTAEAFYDGVAEPFFRIVHDSPSVRWVHSPAAGVDLPFFGGLGERGVRLTTSHVNSIPIAEYVLATVLARYQQLERWREAQRDHAWRHHEFREVFATTWLIVGLGAIGAAVATRAGAFGARVIGVRRRPTGDEPVAAMVTPDQLLDAVPDADVVVLAAPATPATRQLVDARFLAAMRPGSILVNVARGALVDEAALLDALDRGVPDAAILDVFATEPLPPDSPLWAHPRVVVTPHSSSGGEGRHDRAADLFAENLARYARGEPLLHEVDPADVPRRAPGVGSPA
jgi:phosphoglycerate dehydrogenase-like enzyme